MTEQEQIAQFLATRGATLVPQGVGALNHLTARDWGRLHRGEKPAAIDPIGERRVVVDHLGREHVQNGLGEWLK